jgi:NADH-quinone oxidoreductase subunit E
MLIQEIDAIIQDYGTERRYLIPILQDVQAHFNYLPQDALRHVSERLHLPLMDVYSLATFYNCFSLKPRGNHQIKVCLGTACHLNGGTRLMETLGRELGVREGDVTANGQFSYDTVRCLGCCSLAPLVIIDQRYYARMSSRKLNQVINRIEKAENRQAGERLTHMVSDIQLATS